MRIVTMNLEKCVACKNCEYACSFKQRSNFNRSASHMKVNYYPKEKVCIPLTCVHCREPWCMEVCPAGAISRSAETDAVIIDPSKCAGCKMCMLACPFGSIHFDVEKQVSAKCDLCGGDPNCVKFCISGSLNYEEEEHAYEDKRKGFDARLKSLFKKEAKIEG